MLLNVANVRKLYGPDVILDGVSFRLERRQKVALVGRNGTGKSTLLKIIVGDEAPTSGSVTLARGAEIGYLRQEKPVDYTGTVLEEAQNARAHVLELKARLDVLTARLDAGPTPEELEEYATLHEHFMEAEGYSAEREVSQVLKRLGFQEEDFDKPASVLSGGERTRLALARQILEEPDLLILDEPTNHLDIQATEWLESWLQTYPGAVLLVSHDRAFLEKVGDVFLEMREGKVTAYPGPFEKYRKLKAEQDARQAEVARRQQQQIEQLDSYVRRFMNSQRTAQARGRLKQMEKLKATQVVAPSKDKGISGSLAPTKRSGDQVLRTLNLGMQFEGRTLFSGLNWTVRNGERWGVIGENGTGKSTLIKLALGQLEPTEGETILGANVDVGFFSQDAENLDLEDSPLDFLVWECDLTPEQARSLLGRFLISGDDVFRSIRTFSGGEKNKIALARLTALRPNVLVLDEPTNHLDMDSREALAEMLEEYKGTLILVSHDRWLLGKVTHQLLDLRRTGPVFYPGGYATYRGGPATASAAPPKQKGLEPMAPLPTLSPREISKEITRLEKLIVDIESRIEITERAKQEIEAQLASPPAQADIRQLAEHHVEISAQLESEYAQWETSQADLDAMLSLQG